ncbi:MAG: 50S ribosomal protein L19 [Bacteroidia bacterium]|jgi:large subunit ribosomal protein L19|nr:50S ribosomal protein L19 [Bacteroidia bacterium]
MNLINYVENALTGKKEIPAFRAGDTVTVHYKIKEGDKERVQQYQGLVISRRGSGASASFTVRKISNGIGVERIFPLFSPFIDKIELNKEGVVRRAKLYYIRGVKGKKARIEEKQQFGSEEFQSNAAAAATAAEQKAEVAATAKA